MIKDQRKSRRRQIRHAVWIALPSGELHGCVLSDVSDTGARLDVEDSRKLPNRFPLFLSNRGVPRRICRVVWRKPAALGVKFERAVRDANKATLVPAMDADTPPAVKTAAKKKAAAVPA